MQKVYIGSDHRGFVLKEELKMQLRQAGYEVLDKGNQRSDAQDDYVVFAQAVAQAIGADKGSLGIVICGSGVGVSVVANKVDGVRCALVTNTSQAHHARASDDCNIIALASDYTSLQEATEYVIQFLTTSFQAEERMVRRLQQITAIETTN